MKKKKKMLKKEKRVKIFLLILVLGFFFCWGIKLFQKNLEDFFYAQISRPFQEMTFAKMPPKPKKPELNLQSESAISVKINRAGREKIVFKKNNEKGLPIASLTKLMTALLVLENAPQDDYDFYKKVSVSKEAANQKDASIYGNLEKGEILTIEKLLELMLIYSSNDAAFTLSEIIDREIFVEKMNQKVQTLGLKNTHFINPTGLDPEDPNQIPNYSTIDDLIKLSKYILKNYPLIFEISAKQNLYSTKNGFSDLHLLSSQKFIGGKTGYTNKAGGCMLLILKDEKGNCFINVILGTDSPKDRIQEMQKLINWLSL